MDGAFVQVNNDSLHAKSRPIGYTVQSGGCWEWVGATWKGYGYWFRGAKCRAHKVFFEAKYGAVPQGLQLDHLCRNRKCVNPDHLEMVTPKENVLRGLRPQMSRTDRLGWDRLTSPKDRDAAARDIIDNHGSSTAWARRLGVTEQAVRGWVRVRRVLWNHTTNNHKTESR